MYKEIRRAGNTLIIDENELEIKGKGLYCFVIAEGSYFSMRILL
jgi:hypothetical protein